MPFRQGCRGIDHTTHYVVVSDRNESHNPRNSSDRFHPEPTDVAARLREASAPVPRKPLNDLDIVVSAWSDLQNSLAAGFLMNHVHPLAPEGKLLLELASPEHQLRIDVFRQYGLTLARAAPVPLIGDSGSCRSKICGLARRRMSAGAGWGQQWSPM